MEKSNSIFVTWYLNGLSFTLIRSDYLYTLHTFYCINWSKKQITVMYYTFKRLKFLKNISTIGILKFKKLHTPYRL